ncbi:MAG: cysteine desulfurase [Thermoflavifilum sp.]|nr:cysteine desulfurase [Thermoflavifilum sp.]MCL6512905.1 cysteine desulfurase [Alicyclobacillus sp.]
MTERTERIYLDNAASTPVHPEVWAAMAPYLRDTYGNPSSLHHEGRRARAGVEQAREELAAWLRCRPGEIIWTSGATEAIHIALWGLALAARKEGRHHVVVSAIEHHAVLETVEQMGTLGWTVDVVPPREDGTVAVEDVMERVRRDTAIVALMWVNNETGAVQPVSAVAAAVKRHDPAVRVFSDMVQCVAGVTPVIDGVDAAVFSAHKMNGPQGAGALYLHRDVPFVPVMRGGAQERGRRAGTENVAALVGFGVAVRLLRTSWDQHVAHLTMLRDVLWDVLREIPGVRRNSPADAAPGVLNVAFPGIRNDMLLMKLDLAGVSASAGAACTAGSLEPSHVLQAMGQREDEARSAIRFSFSVLNDRAEVRRAGEIIRQIIERG